MVVIRNCTKDSIAVPLYIISFVLSSNTMKSRSNESVSIVTFVASSIEGSCHTLDSPETRKTGASYSSEVEVLLRRIAGSVTTSEVVLLKRIAGSVATSITKGDPSISTSEESKLLT